MAFSETELELPRARMTGELHFEIFLNFLFVIGDGDVW